MCLSIRKRSNALEPSAPGDREAPRLSANDAPTRAAVAPVHVGDPGWLDFPQPGGAKQSAHRGGG
jgi:hypothetical protein